jgi:hypothetical protein
MKYYLLIISIFFTAIAFGQFDRNVQETTDSAYTIPMVTAFYARQWPGGDLANRFGSNNSIGGGFLLKTKKSWVFGFQGNFIWGSKMNNPEVLSNLLSDNGTVIDNRGQLTEVFLGERGSSFFLLSGRVFNVLAPNKNSGIMVYGGLGMLQHKISIKFQDEVASLTDEHKKGYDRFSIGLAANAFIGYIFLSKDRLLNFYGGFDFTMGRTKSLRKFNFDTGLPDTSTQTDLLYGIKVGWMIRFNKRKDENFYYN